MKANDEIKCPKIHVLVYSAFCSPSREIINSHIPNFDSLSSNMENTLDSKGRIQKYLIHLSI